MRFWECYGVSNGLCCVGKGDYEPVNTPGETAVRWRSVLEGLQQMTKQLFDLGLLVTQRCENPLLLNALMDANTATGQLTTVGCEIVGFCGYKFTRASLAKRVENQ